MPSIFWKVCAVLMLTATAALASSVRVSSGSMHVGARREDFGVEGIGAIPAIVAMERETVEPGGTRGRRDISTPMTQGSLVGRLQLGFSDFFSARESRA